jgi:sugar fermentation stimulation protein A
MLRIFGYPPLVSGRLITRYKRFLADVDIGAGKTVTAFCPNSGSMRGLVEPGTGAMLSESTNPAMTRPLSNAATPCRRF